VIIEITTGIVYSRPAEVSIMQISSRFTIAVHVLIAIETFKKDHKITSEFLASSANVNPTVIRRLLQQLKKADIVTVKRGSGGADIERPLTEITLLDVYNAVEPVENGQLFHFHEDPNELCPVGRNIHKIMDHRLEEIQNAMEDKMRRITIADVMADANKLIEN
jgi:Rrf2 family protein